MKNEQWKKNRKKGIGGSDIAAISGVNPYATAYDVYSEKLYGSQDDEEGNDNIIAGNILENAVAKFAEEYYNLTIDQQTSDDDLYVHPEYEIIRGTPDRFYTDHTKKEGIGIMEIKTTQAQIQKNDLPDQWIVQLCWYMGIIHARTGKKVYGSIAYLHSGRFLNFDKVDFEFDDQMQELFKSLMDDAIDFWNNNILIEKAPEPQTPDDVVRLTKKEEIEDKYQEATEEIIKQIEELREKKEQAKALKEEIENMEKTIKMTIGAEYKGLQYEGQKIVDWIPMSGKTSIDQSRLKEEYPEIYEKVKKQGKQYRRFQIKK